MSETLRGDERVTVKKLVDAAASPQSQQNWTTYLAGGFLGGPTQWYEVRCLQFPEGSSTTSQVKRRFNHFSGLRSILRNKFPWKILPKIGEKTGSRTGDNDVELIEFRTFAFQYFLRHVLQVDEIARSEYIAKFLMNDEVSWESFQNKTLQDCEAFAYAPPATEAVAAYAMSLIPSVASASVENDNEIARRQALAQDYALLSTALHADDFTQGRLKSVRDFLRLMADDLKRVHEGMSNHSSHAQTVSKRLEMLNGSMAALNDVGPLGAFTCWAEKMTGTFKAVERDYGYTMKFSVKLCQDLIVEAIYVFGCLLGLYQASQTASGLVQNAKDDFQYVLTHQCTKDEVEKRKVELAQATARSSVLKAELSSTKAIVKLEFASFHTTLQTHLHAIAKRHGKRRFDFVKKVLTDSMQLIDSR